MPRPPTLALLACVGFLAVLAAGLWVDAQRNAADAARWRSAAVRAQDARHAQAARAAEAARDTTGEALWVGGTP